HTKAEPQTEILKAIDTNGGDYGAKKTPGLSLPREQQLCDFPAGRSRSRRAQVGRTQERSDQSAANETPEHCQVIREPQRAARQRSSSHGGLPVEHRAATLRRASGEAALPDS